MAEGTGLLNLHTGNRIEGSNPSLSATVHRPCQIQPRSGRRAVGRAGYSSAERTGGSIPGAPLSGLAAAPAAQRGPGAAAMLPALPRGEVAEWLKAQVC